MHNDIAQIAIVFFKSIIIFIITLTRRKIVMSRWNEKNVYKYFFYFTKSFKHLISYTNIIKNIYLSMFNKIFFFKIYFENKRLIILFSHRLFNEILNNWNTIANACNYVTTVDKILLDNVGIFHNEKEKEVELFSLEIKIKTLWIITKQISRIQI